MLTTIFIKTKRKSKLLETIFFDFDKYHHLKEGYGIHPFSSISIEGLSPHLQVNFILNKPLDKLIMIQKAVGYCTQLMIIYKICTANILFPGRQFII